MMKPIFSLLGLLAATVSLAAADPAAPASALMKAREGHVTKLIKQESEGKAAPTPPEGTLEKIQYTSPVGKLGAYLSPAPKGGKRHALVIWLTAGDRNGINAAAWEEGHLYSAFWAPAYRMAEIAVMYPTLRGGNDNPGHREALYGEVDDVLAAVDHAAKLPWVDPTRIYLGGCQTGGTLALLVAEAADKNRLRAVFSFSPAADPIIYGQSRMPFDLKDDKERRLRSPVNFLDDISCTTLVIDAEETYSATESFKGKSRNPNLNFIKTAGKDYFAVLEPTNTLLAERILQDTGDRCSIKITGEEIVAASKQADEDSAKRLVNRDIGKGGSLSMDIIFYYGTDPATPPREAMRMAVEKEMKGIPVLYDYPPTIAPPFIILSDAQDVLESYPAPDADSLHHSGHGLSEEDIGTIQKTSRAVHLRLFKTPDARYLPIKAFNKLAYAFAVETKAFICDKATRECFHRDAWKAQRIDGWGEGEIPDIRSQIAIHCYPKGPDGNFRSVTRGMEKFGIYDVVIEHSVDSEAAAACTLMQAFCQSIASNPVLKNPMHFPVSLDALPPGIAKSYREGMLKGGTGKVELAIMRGSFDEGHGDPGNELVELDFRYGKGGTDDERRAELLKRFWGVKGK